jgi:hypothetical protein
LKLGLTPWRPQEEMRQILVERARLRGIIPYSDLVSRIGTIRMEPDSFALAHMLGEIDLGGGGRCRAGHALGHRRPQSRRHAAGFLSVGGETGARHVRQKDMLGRGITTGTRSLERQMNEKTIG